MKKSLIALAVAGAFAAPAFAATSNVDVYGILSVAIEDLDTTNSDLQVTDRVSRIGFKGAEDLGGGLKGVWQIESQLSATGNMTGTDGVGGSQTLAGRNTFVGLAGGFGTALIGRHDTPYKLGTGKLDIFADTMGDYNFGGVNLKTLLTGSGLGSTVTEAGYMNAVHDHRSPDAIAYISPTFSGFHAAVAAVATNNNAALNAGDTFDAYSLTGIYENGPLFVSLSYQTVDEADTALGLFTDTNLNGTLDAGEVSGGIVDGSDAWKLGVGYAFGDLKLGLVYENVGVDITGGGDVDIDGWMVNAAYGMGPITLKAAYNTHTLESTALGADVDADGWILGADYALSKRTTAYIIYRTDDVDAGAGTDKDGWGLGVKHSF